MSSLPTYFMGFYSLPLGTHKKMDTIRSSFSWRGVVDWAFSILRYSMNVWLQSGYGRYKQKESLWAILLTTKYMRNCDLFRSSDAQGSQF
jgi:hypothetical protein